MAKFCTTCDNLFSFTINSESQKLSYVCHSCGNSEDTVDSCIVINEMDSKTQDYQLNAQMVHDRTMPRTLKVPCPNPDCGHKTEGKSGNPEIIMFQYNPKMLKMGYMCVVCHTYWKN